MTKCPGHRSDEVSGHQASASIVGLNVNPPAVSVDRFIGINVL